MKKKPKIDVPLSGLKVELFRNGFVPMPPGVVLTNGGEQCDMFIGPCSCGASHCNDFEWDVDANRYAEAVRQQNPDPPGLRGKSAPIMEPSGPVRRDSKESQS